METASDTDHQAHNNRIEACAGSRRCRPIYDACVANCSRKRNPGDVSSTPQTVAILIDFMIALRLGVSSHRLSKAGLRALQGVRRSGTDADDRLPLRRSVGFKAATASSRVETLPMFVPWKLRESRNGGDFEYTDRRLGLDCPVVIEARQDGQDSNDRQD